MHFRHVLPALLVAISNGAFASPASPPPPKAAEAALLNLVKHAEYRFNPEVKAAYLSYAKTTALAALKTAGRDLPADFLAWIDSDPVVAATVYGARRNAADVLVMLRSLELDLGVQAVRKDFTQLALAMAIVHAAEAKDADLTPREPLKVVISGDPRKPVNTKDPSRQLDLNDHIINFLNDNTLEEDVVVGHKDEPPPLKYDDKGIAIPPPKNAKPVNVPITEKRRRSLYAADVIASKAWQEKFNAYMKKHGQEVSIDCGDQLVSWISKAAVRAECKQINDAFVMFRTAYEAKGLLPAARDPLPTPGESAAYYIRNNSYVFPEEVRSQRNWPRYPLTAPWPTLTLLAADSQPLREREERWLAFRDKGETRTYGEYIGPIAQQFDMQSARRITPHPFTYGTYQMMAKDGGVCGTMANMGVRTYNTLGIPSCTAGQPGHCALILFACDPKTQLYDCKGGQFATGGPDKTSPHTPWVFGDTDARKGMLYYQTIAWAVNFGLQSYLDSTIAYQLFRTLPEADRTAHGLDLLDSALARNPFNILLADAAQAQAATPQDQIRFWHGFQRRLAAVTQPGCPKDGLYNQTVRANLFAKIAKLPVPADSAAVRNVLAFLRQEQCPNPEALVVYQIAVEGLPRVAAQTQTAFREHLASARTDASCQTMAAAVTALTTRMPDIKLRTRWTTECWKTVAGRECYLGAKDKLLVDPAVAALAKLCAQKLRPEAELHQPVLDQLTVALKTRVTGTRDAKEAKRFAATLTTVAGQLKDPAQTRAWLDKLAAIIKGHEEFPAGRDKSQRDPTEDAIANLLATPVPTKP
jgi:hypothetical protein